MRTSDPLSPDPLRVPVDGDRSSGYRHVYYRGTDLQGRPTWHAKVRVCGRLVPVSDSRSHCARDSARAVARWYFERYGAKWPNHLRRALRPPYAVRCSERRGGWCARVWVQGEPCEVPRLRWRRGECRYRRGTVGVWSTRAEAVRAARRFLWWQLGYLQDEFAFRCEEAAALPGANMHAAALPVMGGRG